VQLIEPRAVATLGLRAMNALLASHALPPQERLPNPLAPVLLPSGATLFPMHHPSSRGRLEEDHLRDWRVLGKFLSGGIAGTGMSAWTTTSELSGYGTRSQVGCSTVPRTPEPSALAKT
jgi:hypothetical protein